MVRQLLLLVQLPIWAFNDECIFCISIKYSIKMNQARSPRLGREQNRIKKKNLCNLEDLDSTKMAGKAKARRSKRDKKTHNDDAVKHCSAEEGNNTIITPLQAISISANKHNEK